MQKHRAAQSVSRDTENPPDKSKSKELRQSQVVADLKVGDRPMDDIVNKPDVLLQRLLLAIDGGKASDVDRAALERGLHGVWQNYKTHWRSSAEAKKLKRLMQKMRANTAQRRKLRLLLDRDGNQEIARADWMRTELRPTIKTVMTGDRPIDEVNPVDDEINRRFDEFRTGEKLEEREDLAVGFWIEERQRSYKKTSIRKVVVEPFLAMLYRGDMLETAQPVTDAVIALFDWLEIKPRDRLKEPGIRTVIREFVRDDLPVWRRVFGREKRLKKIVTWRLKAGMRRERRISKLLKISAWRVRAIEARLRAAAAHLKDVPHH